MPGNNHSGDRARNLWRIGLVLTVGSTLGVALAVGGAHPTVLLVAVPVCLLGYACLFASFPMLEGAPTTWPAPVWVFLGLSGYTLLQALPLPLHVLEALSPVTADTWHRALAPFGEQVDWGALSLEPGASLREALKWLLYGLNFGAAILVTRRHGRRVTALVVFGTASLIAVATVCHGLAQAKHVFGIYKPPLSGWAWAVGPFLNPNTLAAYLNLGGFVGLGLVTSGRFEQYRWLLAAGVALLFAVTLLSGSRGGILVIPIGLLVFGVLRHRARSRKSGRVARKGNIQLLPLLGAVLLAVILAGLAAGHATWNPLAQRDLDKLKLVGWSVPMLADYWQFGVGRGAFGSVFPAYAPPANIVFSYPENLLVQWATEWGIVPALIAALAFAWVFRPRQVSSPSQNLVPGAAAGVVVLLLQNLVDFGLERVASPLALTWALAILWKADRAAMQKPDRSHQPALQSGIALVTGVLLWLGVLFLSPQDLMGQKRVLYDAARGLSAGDRAAVDAFRARLREAMLKAPAEPYFARLGAEVSLLTGNRDVLRWVSRALERGMNDSGAHILAAQALRRYGATNQALMQLRSAAELDPMRAATSGRLAAAWANSVDDLSRAAPKGTTGAKVLTVAAGEVDGPKAQWRLPILSAAVNRDRTYTPARHALVEHLARRVKEGECQELAPCAEAALKEAEVLISQTPNIATGYALKAQILQSLGRESGAAALLAKACGAVREDQRPECLRARLSLARSRSAPNPAEIATVATELSELPCEDGKACTRLYTELGHALVQAGDPAGAMVQFERAVQREPNPRILIKIAELAVELGQFHRAEGALDRAERAAKGKQIEMVSKKRALLQARILRNLVR